MKQSEKYQLQAEEKGHLATKQQAEIDLRAGQIDKLNQESAQFQQLRDKYEQEQQDLIQRAQQEAQKEESEAEQQRRQALMLAAMSVENNEQREAA